MPNAYSQFRPSTIHPKSSFGQFTPSLPSLVLTLHFYNILHISQADTQSSRARSIRSRWLNYCNLPHLTESFTFWIPKKTAFYPSLTLHTSILPLFALSSPNYTDSQSKYTLQLISGNNFLGWLCIDECCVTYTSYIWEKAASVWLELIQRFCEFDP